MTKTALDFVQHWTWAGKKGLMAMRTAQAYAGACRQVLSIQDDWENLNFETLEVDNLLLRFKNLSGLSPASLATYEGRFRRAVKSYQTYLNDPAKWQYTPRRQSRSVQSRSSNRTRAAQQTASSPNSTESSSDALLEYIFPFRNSTNARVAIPRDATTAEINRLADFLRPLAVDYESSSS